VNGAMNRLIVLSVFLLSNLLSFSQKYIGVREANDSSIYTIIPFTSDVHVFTNGNIMTGTTEEIMVQAQSLGLNTDTLVKNVPRVILKNNLIKNDTTTLLNWMRLFYKWNWTIIGDVNTLTFLNPNITDYRRVSSAMLDLAATQGNYYNFHLYLRIPANQLNVTVPDGVPGKITGVTTWATWANKRSLIVRNSGGAVIVPLETKSGKWWTGKQIAAIMAANTNLTRYTDVNWENQLGGATWYKVTTCTESITGRTDYYTYAEWSNFVLLAKK
jgi:hypothetical protein